MNEREQAHSRRAPTRWGEGSIGRPMAEVDPVKAQLARIAELETELFDVRAQNNFLHEEHKLVLSSEAGLLRENKSMREQLDIDHAAMVEGTAALADRDRQIAELREALAKALVALQQ